VRTIFYSPGKPRPDSLAWDHLHGTLNRRTFLCHQHNAALGNFQDDPINLTRAATLVMARGTYTDQDPARFDYEHNGHAAPGNRQ